MALSVGFYLACAATLVGALPSAPRERDSEGRLAVRTAIVLQPPAGQGMTVQGGVIMAYARSGRLLLARRFDAGEFAQWTSGRVRLSAGEQLLFSHRLVFGDGDEPVRGSYVFSVVTTAGAEMRLVRPLALGGTEPAGDEAGPRFEVYTQPDELQAVRLGRSKRLAWGFNLQFQETNGFPVVVQSVTWAARNAAGQPVAEGRLDAASIGRVIGGTTQCGPDGLFVVPGQKVVAPVGQEPTELVLSAVAQRPNGGTVSAMQRVPLKPPAERPARTRLLLPVRGPWRVALGPGDPPHVGSLAYTWLFDRIDRAGKPHGGDGSLPGHHYAYGQAVFAPAAGAVWRLVDAIPDSQTPVAGGLFANFGGENYVMIDHGNGEFSYLSGLRYRSTRLTLGQKVATSEYLGQIGCCDNGLGRPALRYRLLRQHGDGDLADTLEARFVDWRPAAGAVPAMPSAPEGGDLIVVP